MSFTTTREDSAAKGTTFTVSTFECADIWDDRNALFGEIFTPDGPTYVALGEANGEKLISVFEHVGGSVRFLAGRKATTEEISEYMDYRGPLRHAKMVQDHSRTLPDVLSDFCSEALPMDVVTWNTTIRLDEEEFPHSLELDPFMARRVRRKALDMGLDIETFVRHCILGNL